MSQPSTTLTELRRHFGDQVFTAEQARDAGITRFRLEAAGTDDRLVRVARGTYRLAGQKESREAHLDRARAVLLDRPSLVLAGVSAAAAWGLPCANEWGDWSALPLTFASPAKVSLPPGATGFRLAERTWTKRAGLPVTDLVPTALDVAWQLPLPNALIVLDAIALRLVGRQDRGSRAAAREPVRAMLLAAMPARPRPGDRRIRAAAGLADPAADSPPESYIRGHVLAGGLPEPVVNAPVIGASGRGYFADLYWPQAKLVVEVDGAVKYTDRGVIVAEKRRERDLRDSGHGFRRFEAWEVFAHSPLLVVKIREALLLRYCA